jgi:hypothetical protein
VAYDGKSKRIKNALVSVLTAITYNDESAFTQVLDNSRNVFDSYPNVQVLPGDVSNEKTTTGQTDRTPAYIIRIRIPLEDANQTQSTAYDHMYDLTDLVLDELDTSDHDSTLNDIDPTLGVYMMDATRGDWMVVPSSGGDTLLCDVNVQVTYSKDL